MAHFSGVKATVRGMCAVFIFWYVVPINCTDIFYLIKWNWSGNSGFLVLWKKCMDHGRWTLRSLVAQKIAYLWCDYKTDLISTWIDLIISLEWQVPILPRHFRMVKLFWQLFSPQTEPDFSDLLLTYLNVTQLKWIMMMSLLVHRVKSRRACCLY